MRDTCVVRAAGLQGDPSSEIIEILDDDTDVFGNRAPSPAPQDSGGPRWAGPIAGLALVSLIGYGVATSTSSGGVPKVAPAPSTTAATNTTMPAPTTTLPAPPPVPYYAADPPRDYKVQYAEFTQDDVRYGRSDFQLWATPDATGTTGSWFSIFNQRGQSTIYAQNAYRLRFDHGTVAISHSPFGQTSVQLSNDRSSSAVFTAFGWTDEDLIRLAESVNFDTAEPSFTDASLVADYELISTVEPWLIVQGMPLEQIYYGTSAHPYAGVGISVAPLDGAEALGGGVDRQTAIRFLLDHETEFMVDGHAAVAGALINQSGVGLATWTAGDHIVTVTGQVTVPQLIAIARTVHEVTPGEWEGMKFQAIQNNSENNAGRDFIEPVPVPISFGTDSDGKPWTIRVALATYGNVRQIDWAWGFNGPDNVTTPDDTAQINTFVGNDRAYVLADLPRSIAASAQLQVSRGGLEPFVVPFNDIDPTLDRTFAAFAFSETGPYTAQIVAADGAVITSWPSS